MRAKQNLLKVLIRHEIQSLKNKVSYKFFIDHIEERGDIVDIRFMIELFDANIGIGYWFDASKTEEDFDWAFDVFKIQMKTGYDVSYFNSHVRNFLRSNR